MTLREILEAFPFIGWIGNDTIGLLSIAVIIMSLVEISPIKLNPWKALGKVLQDFLGISEIRKELMDNRRTRILQFDDELMHGLHHGKDLWDAALIDCDKYEAFCSEHKDYVNSIANESINHIKETYHRLKDNGEFASKKR